MRTLVLADAHGTPALIENALSHAQENGGYDEVVFAGDLLDIGDEPEKCLAILEEEGAVILWGNHEHAILIGMTIWPQDPESWTWRGFLMDQFAHRQWHLAVARDGILITHAGVSKIYLSKLPMAEDPGGDVDELVDELNEDFYTQTAGDLVYSQTSGPHRFVSAYEHGPLWYRPELLEPIDIEQVCGHTPPMPWHAKRFPNLHMVDPYARGVDMKTDRYRYAIIDHGKVTVYDSRDAK